MTCNLKPWQQKVVQPKLDSCFENVEGYGIRVNDHLKGKHGALSEDWRRQYKKVLSAATKKKMQNANRDGEEKSYFSAATATGAATVTVSVGLLIAHQLG